MTTGVIYLLTSMKLASRLLVSIYSLRKWYDGPISVFTTKPKAYEFGQLLAAESRLRVEVCKCRQRPGRGYQAAYLTKTDVLQHSPYEATIFFDADTLIVGSIAELVESAADVPVTATCFCNWKTTDEIMRKRIEAWRPLAGAPGDEFDLQSLIDMALSVPFAAINSGVFAVQRESRFLIRWRALTWYAREHGFPDEVSLQLLLPTTEHRLLGMHFNAHPYSIEDTDFVRIWHFAGFSHLDPLCRDLWLQVYEECYNANLVGLQSLPAVTQLPIS